MKKIRKQLENNKTKKKKNTHTNRPPPQAPLLSRYIFLMKYMHLRKPGFELPSSSLVRTFLTATLHSHLWLYGVCYSFILIMKLICKGRWRHHPPQKIFFYFIKKNI